MTVQIAKIYHILVTDYCQIRYWQNVLSDFFLNFMHISSSVLNQREIFMSSFLDNSDHS
jgi:hypothetical protein